MTKRLFLKKFSRATLLLVDDEPDLRSLLKLILENAGFRVLTAESGEAALRIFWEHPEDVDLAILDLVLPGIDGLETSRELWGTRKDLPVVLKTAHPDKIAKGSVAAQGFVGVVHVPFDVDELISLIKNTLKID